MKETKPKRSRAEVTLASVLQKELDNFRRDFRATFRAYSARLEVDLAEVTKVVSEQRRSEELDRQAIHDLRELMILVRKRKLRPEKGRRKDLRKLDTLIRDMHSLTHPNVVRE